MGLTSPTENSLVKLAYEGALRLWGKSVNKKDAYRLGPDNLLHMRTTVVILFGFSGFFSISELLSVTLKNVSILDDQLQIFLEISKRDQHRQGNEVIITRTWTSCCLVAFVENFLNQAGFDVDVHLVPRLDKIKNGYKASRKHGISEFRIQPFAKNNANNSPHSLRSGGASRASD